ncbi:hypothetical protein C9374_011423 [Naegleria lovaniensis]|uniref:E1 ubiquitin-activating enzyme n=1 Tax=Naegleria lovaniensis TaxID=51637 RepID=A0AA88H0V6_NAELO|nr:uncharacterized protein C9374_011423 [Naegleria lovaniensis]KAG2392698.1 hypothetical protein C9374_011423 [Naegleria lovaniensis]
MLSSNHTNNNSQDRMVDEDHQEVDEKLYSRQLYVLGVDAMKRMQQSNVLICGLGGLGVEVAKNVILTGVKSVTLYDPKNVTFDDLSAQFYASEKDIGQNRAEVSLQQLKELNQYVPVKIHKGDLTEDFITQFAVVVFTDTHIPQLVEMNEICHKHNVRFIACESRGLMGSLFCDFGTNFTVYDPDGENVVSNIVTDITNGYPATVTVYDDKPTHGLYDDEYVQFEGIEGMDEINKVSEPIKIKVSGKHTFKIDLDTRNFGEYKSGSGGYVKQVKVPTSHSYQPLKDQLANPTCIDFDFAKFSRPQQIHLAMLALSEYEKRNQSLPKPYNKADAERLLEIAKEIAPDALKEHLDEKIVKLLAYTCRGNLNPMAAFLGGIVAQETQKACSGKFSPLNQYFHFDALECLPEDESSYPTEEDCQPTSTRYDGQISVFGKAFQHKLADVKEFVVGAGALGCEFLKNYAMMGVGCGPNGKVFVTDMDSIEVSNLNRQFLFRRRHVGQQKSTTAAEAVKAMNPEFHVIALQDKVAPETEQTFDDDFWEQLSGVTNALDNVQARLYVDTRCVYYGKPLLESGTLGTKGNTQVVVPKLTESYGTTRDPPEKEIPICTLKNFPNAIEHTIQWARDSFEGFFNKVPNDVNTYLSKTDYIKELDSLASKKAVLESVYESLVSNKPLSFEDCISWARLKFEQLFRNNIMQLLYNFPLDMVTSTGTPFWGGAKRPPVPLSFDPNDPLHLDFVVSAANLRAFVYGLKGGSKDEYDFKAIVSKIKVPPFQPKSGVKIQSDEKENKEPEQEFSDSDEQEMQQLQSQIPKPNDMAGFRLNVAEFEKDDDTNYHIDFITAASNLRARNYKIPEVDRHKTKGIAGKIIPAMVTTTALITGLVGFEFYKLMQGFNKIAAFKNAFVNIALPFVTFSEPGEPPKQKYLDVSWTLWDRFEVDEGRDITLKEFMDIFKERFKLEITMMSAGKSMIYSFFGNKKAIEEKMKTPLGQLVETVSQTQFLPKQKYVNFEICCQDLENGDDQEVPYVRYKFRGW